MHDPLTLYGPAPLSERGLFRFPLIGAGNPLAVSQLIGYVPAPAHPLPLAAIEERLATSLDRGDTDAALAPLADDLAGLCGPLLVVLVQSSDEGGATVRSWPSAGFDRFPSRALLIGPAGEQFIDLRPGDPVGVGLAEHLVLALDDAAAESLGLWFDRLKGFDPDLRRLLLLTLASPALDARLARIEAEVTAIRSHLAGASVEPDGVVGAGRPAVGLPFAVSGAMALGTLVGWWLHSLLAGAA